MEEKVEKYTEKDFLSAYIGDDVQKYESIDANWVAAALGEFIGPVWFFYRKAYLVGFGFIFLTFIIAEITSRLNIEKAYYFMGLIYLFTANKAYLWDVKRKVNKIIENNSELGEMELIELLNKKGGTSSVAATIYVVTVVGLVVLYLAVIISIIANMASLLS